MVSVLPAGCTRRLELTDVEWTWGAFRLSPGTEELCGLRSLQMTDDLLLISLFRELEWIGARDGAVDTTLASSMSTMVGAYLGAKYLQMKPPGNAFALPAWRLRRLREYVAANLHRPIAVEEIAAEVGLSERQLHRALRATTGQTPLALVTDLRIDRARDLLARTEAPIVEIARAVGFASPSHLALVFRRITGVSPAIWRRDAK
jgi:AraC family transcriptional regulator